MAKAPGAGSSRRWAGASATPTDPLLVSVRSGAKFSMPGMMDTVLNLGLNDESVEGLAKQTDDERFAYDSYRRFVAMYGRIVLGVPGEEFDALLDAAKELAGTASDAEIPSSCCATWSMPTRQIVERAHRPSLPPGPRRPAARRHRGRLRARGTAPGPSPTATRERIPHDLGTAVNVQAMVFGNRDDNSGTGVGFTRDPATGDKGEYGDFLVNAQGEDVVAGIRNTEPLSALRDRFPTIHEELLEIFARLEAHYRDMCDTEFTIEQGKLWMLQTRVGKRTGRAALRMAVEMVRRAGHPPDPKGSRAADHRRARRAGAPPAVRRDGSPDPRQGLGASPGAAVGNVYLTADDAAGGGRAGRASRPRPLARRPPRTCTACSPPRGS